MEREKSRPSNSSGTFPKILTNKRNSSSHTHNTFGSSHSKEDFSSGIRVCCTIKEEGPRDGSSPTSLYGASGSTDLVNTEANQSRTPSAEVRVTHEKVSLMEKCGSVDNEPQTNDNADVTNNQPKIQHNSSVQSELQTTLLSQPERPVLINRDAHPKPLKAVQRKKRSHHPRDSMKSKTGRRVRNANKHLRTAVMFILITASFLISYLPTLLITNGFIWRVEWETTSASATDEIFNVTLEKWIGYMKSASIDGSGDNHTKLHLSNLNSGVRRTTETESASVYSYALKDHFHMSELTYHLRRLVHFLYFVNSATNPLIYFFLNLKFRGELRQLYRRMRLHCAR
ncbi:unnamed protein product [Calicophoron daubneyi]|uniref:G-protein coupled receptors family 1 profile domain-containing protein n=1 Tax=Calicophoron daubneyi TaxID=300641 RepID=A0AAV2T436_CALDB